MSNGERAHVRAVYTQVQAMVNPAEDDTRQDIVMINKCLQAVHDTFPQFFLQ
jgi:hypothetical protein